VKRRRFLGTLAATAGFVGLAGCGDGRTEPTATATETAPALDFGRTSLPAGVPATPDAFDRVVDATDVGADPSGTVPITGVLKDELRDGTLLVFPDGTYSLDPFVARDLQDVGLVAASGASPTFKPLVPAETQGNQWIQLFGVDGFLLQGIDLDVREDGHAGRVMVVGPGDFAIRHLTARGVYDVDDVISFRFDVRDPDGTAVVDSLRARGVDRRIAKTTGVYVGRLHAGEIRFRNCVLENFSDNGLYASAPGGDGGNFEGRDGPVHVEGGLFRNNNIANVRIGSTGSTVRGATIVVDERPPLPSPEDENVRGIRLRGKHDQLVENCSITYTSEAGWGFGAVRFHSTNGTATIRNTRIHLDRDEVPAVSAGPPDRKAIDGPVGPSLEDVYVTGDAGGGETVHLRDRDGTTLSNVCVSQTGPDRDGFRFDGCADCVVRDSTVDVTGAPFVLEESEVVRKEVTTDGAKQC